MLPSQMMPAFDGVVPSCIITSSACGIPNITNLSRVWLVDAEHVAIANQMLNKSENNLLENPLAIIKIPNPVDWLHWELTVTYIYTQQEGPLYDKLRLDLHTISWMAGSDTTALRSIMVFRVVSVRKCLEEAHHLSPAPELFGDLLKVLATAFDWSRSSYWVPNKDSSSPQLVASRGVPGAGTNRSALEPMKRLAALVEAERRIFRFRNIRSQMKYLMNLHPESNPSDENRTDSHPEIPLPTSFLAFPIVAFGSLLGIVCFEETDALANTFDHVHDDFITLLASKLGETLSSIAAVPEMDREPFFRQIVERTKLEWTKATDPFHTVLSARERQVSIHVAKGRTNPEIAKELFISTRTVSTHLERIFEKLQVNSRSSLTRYIVEKGLLDESEGK